MLHLRRPMPHTRLENTEWPPLHWLSCSTANTKACQSDAYFYLAIIGLEMDDPNLTIECLSNIEDLARYGEDITGTRPWLL